MCVQVLVQIVDNHVHRVYICKEGDKGQEVLGVVTPTDILSLIAGQAGWLRRALSMRANSSKRQASMPSAAAAAVALDAAIAEATAAVMADVVDGAAAAGDSTGHKKARVDEQ
jgi:hypothetical protein